MESFKGSHAEAVVRTLLGEPNPSLSTRTEYRYGQRGSLVVNLEEGTWFDHERNCGGGWIDLYVSKREGSRGEAAEWLKGQGIQLPGNAHPVPRRNNPKPRIVKTYDYRDESGTLLFEVVRFEPKSFRQRRPNGAGGWIWNIKQCRRVLYRLPELMAADPDAIVYLVEGEKDTDRLASLGLVATTNPGGASKWRSEYLEFLKGRLVVVLSDNDEAGEVHAAKLVNALRGGAKRVALLRLDGLPPKGDVSDWIDAGGTVVDLEARASNALASPDEPPPAGPGVAGFGAYTDEPIPLYRPMETAEPVPMEYLGPFKEVVEAIETLTDAPEAIGLQSILGAASLAVQGLVDVETMAGPSPTSLALLTIAQSGERKSACDTLALSEVRAFERERQTEYKIEREKHGLKLAAYEADKKAILKNKDKDERDADLEALGAAPLPPLGPYLLFRDPTTEGILRNFDEGRPSIGVFSDEGGQMLGGYAMKSENKGKTGGALSDLWGGRDVDRARASAPPIKYYGVRVAFHLMVQPGIGKGLLSDMVVRDQGFLARLLFAFPESRIGYRFGAPEKERGKARAALERFNGRIRSLLELPLAVGDDPRQLNPALLTLSDGARRLLNQFYDTVEVAQRSNRVCSGIRDYASKACEQAARIAGVMTRFASDEAEEIPVEIMAAAIGLMDWYLREALRLLNSTPLDEQTERAELLRIWLMERWSGDEISVREVVRNGPRALRTASEIKKLFAKLEQLGWLVKLPRNGRKDLWRIIRK